MDKGLTCGGLWRATEASMCKTVQHLRYGPFRGAVDQTTQPLPAAPVTGTSNRRQCRLGVAHTGRNRAAWRNRTTYLAGQTMISFHERGTHPTTAAVSARRGGFAFLLTFLIGLSAFTGPALSVVTVHNRDDCASLHGTVLSTSSSTAEAIVVDLLLDTDYVEIQLLVYGDNGTIRVEIRDDAAVLLDRNYVVGGGIRINDGTTYDPGSDLTPATFVLTTTFSAGSAAIAEYTILCKAGGGTATVVPPLAAVTTAFLNERARNLLAAAPDRARMVRKRLDALWGGVEPASSSSAYANGSAAGVRASPAGARARVSLQDLFHVSAVDLPTGSQPPVPVPPAAPSRLGCWDVWGEAHYRRFSGAANRAGDFAIGYLGADCQLHPAAVAGFLVQVDWMDDRIGVANSDTRGTGWMAGPYATLRLAPDLFLDIRGAWGQSRNDIDVGGVTGRFDTDRWLVSGQLTGSVDMGRWRVSPELSVSYIREDQEAYTASNGMTVAARTVSLGWLQFGPEIATRYDTASGVVVEPQLALRGAWDFDTTGGASLGGVAYPTGALRGIAEIGVTIRRPDRFNMRLSARYDGIGLGNYHAWGGQVWLNVPLN